MSLSLVLSQAVLGDEAWVLLCSHSKSHVEQSGKIHAKFLNPATSLSTDKCAQALSTVTSKKKKKKKHTTLLAVQWLRLCASNAGGLGWIAGWGTRIPHAMGHSKKKKQNTTNPVTSKGHSLSQIECITLFLSVT